MSVGYTYRKPSPEEVRPYIDSKQPRFSEKRGEQPRPKNEYITSEKQRVIQRMLAKRAGLPEARYIEEKWRNLGSQELPIYAKRGELLGAVRDNQISLLEGETGSGKSTQAWQYLIGEGYERVYVLVPRRVIAENLFERARDEITQQRDSQLAENAVGIAHSEHSELSDDNKVVFITSETFHKLNDKIHEELGDKPTVIISDEIHEANLPTEMATAIAAKQLADHPKWRLILSSATQDKERIHKALDPVNKRPIPVISVEGRPHAMEIVEKPFSDAATVYADNYYDHSLSLFFTSGKYELDVAIGEFQAELEARKKGSSKDVIFRKLHAKISEKERQRLNDAVPEGKHAVIVCTPAGMSGMTFPGATMVISDGLVKRPELDKEGTPGLFKRQAAQSEVMQMFGRGGRDVDGGIGFLVDPFEDDEAFTPLDSREEHAPAEIYNTNISRNVLTALSYGYSFYEINKFALHPVNDSVIHEAYESLYRLGAIGDDDEVTPIGADMNKFPLRPELSRGLVEALRQGRSVQTLARLAIVTAAVESGGLAYFAHDAGNKWRKMLRDTTKDDYIAQLDMYFETRQFDNGHTVYEEALLRHDIDPKNAYRTRKQAEKIMRLVGINPHKLELDISTEEEEQEVRDLLLAGMTDLVYEKTGTFGRGKPVYTSVTHGNEEDGPTLSRVSSDRSVVDRSAKLVAGWPRRYEKSGEMHHIVEMAMPASAAVLGQYVARLMHDEIIGAGFKKGQVVERVQPTFGRLPIGRPKELTPTRSLSPEAEKMLYEQVITQQGEAQRTLRRIARELEYIQESLSPEMQQVFLGDTEILTQQVVDEWLRLAVLDSTSVHEVDSKLRAKIHDESISLDNWITPQKHQELSKLYPQHFELLDGSYCRLKYDQGLPVATGVPISKLWKLPYECRLPDGREIYFQMMVGDTKHLLSVNELRRMHEVTTA